MELKRVLRDLKLVNNVNRFSLEELKTLYASDEQTYDYFIERFSNVFNSDGLYQIRLSEQYDKVRALLDYGNLKFESESNNELYNDLTKRINYNERRFRTNKRPDDRNSTFYSFAHRVGAPDKSYSTRAYCELVNQIYQGAVKYSEVEEDSIGDFLTYVSDKLDIEGTDKEEFSLAIQIYASKHAMLFSICNDPEFLYFANFMILKESSNVDLKFTDDIKNVIKASKVLQKIGFTRDDLDEEKYNQLADFTEKKLKEVEKSKKKKEDIGLRKIKQLFT